MICSIDSGVLWLQGLDMFDLTIDYIQIRYTGRNAPFQDGNRFGSFRAIIRRSIIDGTRMYTAANCTVKGGYSFTLRKVGAGCQCMDAYFCLVFVLKSWFCPAFVLVWSHLCPVPVLCPSFDSFLSTLFSVLSQSGLVSVIAGSVLSPFCPVLSLKFLENLGDKF